MTPLTSKQFRSLYKKIGAGGITASEVVKMAESPASPLHSLFEWTDKKAAHAYRLIQARKIIKRCNMSIKEPENKVVHVPAIAAGPGIYKTMDNVVQSVSEFEQALEQAVQRLKSAETTVNDLHRVAQIHAPDKVAILAVALKGLETAETALSKMH